MIAYKLLSQDLTSFRGSQWSIGKKQIVTEPGTKMCSDQVLHCYSHPLMAAMFNPIHANIANPKLFKIETSEIINSDFSKLVCKEQTLLEELPMPLLTAEQRQEVAIRAAMTVTGASNLWISWAEKWLSGEDRTIESESHAHAYSRAHAYPYDCNHAYSYACARVYAHAYPYACAYACAHTYIYACAYAHSHILTQEQILNFLLATTKTTL